MLFFAAYHPILLPNACKVVENERLQFYRFVRIEQRPISQAIHDVGLFYLLLKSFYTSILSICITCRSVRPMAIHESNARPRRSCAQQHNHRQSIQVHNLFAVCERGCTRSRSFAYIYLSIAVQFFFLLATDTMKYLFMEMTIVSLLLFHH